MIVKDEANVIERCLTSVLPVIDCFIICDTGSQDGTQGVVRSLFAAAGIPGLVVDRPWRNFAHNRNESLALARTTYPEADDLFSMDADEELHLDDPAGFRDLTRDAYWCGRYQEALAANERLRHRVPPTEQERIERNRAFCLAKLKEGGGSALQPG
jgi:glycosyltransferase involved in cell wall biosynthesis